MTNTASALNEPGDVKRRPTAEPPKKSPRTRNAVKTQEQILVAAQAEFARKGYDGGRIDAIAARAKVSKNLIYHYFDSKEGLYVRVLERTYETLRRRQDEIPLHGLDPVAAMTALCECTFQVLIDEPDIIVMMNCENLHRGRHISKSPIIRTLYQNLASSLKSILDKGAEDGVFRPDLDPVDLYISISGLGYFYLSNRFTLSMLFDRDLKKVEYLRKRKAHIVEMILKFVSASSTSAASLDPV